MSETTIPKGAYVSCPNTIDLGSGVAAKNINVSDNCPTCEHFKGIGDTGTESPNWDDRYRLVCRYPTGRHVIMVEVD